MSKLSARKRRVKRTVSIGKVAPEAVGQVEDLDGRIEAIQWLIPLGLKAVTEELQRAVVELAGPRYERKGSDQPLRRWGSQPGLKLMNQSALSSLEKGFEETLTLHRLGLMPMLKDSFRTTNCIENVNSLLAQLTHNVRRWTNSSQRHRWVATALLDIEPRLRRVRGFHHLPMLRQAIQAELGIKQLAMTG